MACAQLASHHIWQRLSSDSLFDSRLTCLIPVWLLSNSRLTLSTPVWHCLTPSRQVFSSLQDGSCTFEDFLDMMSVLSVNAPKTVKSEYAFRIFDFDNDDMIGREDLRELINRLDGAAAHHRDGDDGAFRSADVAWCDVVWCWCG